MRIEKANKDERMKMGKVTFRVLVFLAIVLFIFMVFCQWMAYSQFIQGMGQQPDIFGFIGWWFTLGGGK